MSPCTVTIIADTFCLIVGLHVLLLGFISL